MSGGSSKKKSHTQKLSTSTTAQAAEATDKKPPAAATSAPASAGTTATALRKPTKTVVKRTRRKKKRSQQKATTPAPEEDQKQQQQQPQQQPPSTQAKPTPPPAKRRRKTSAKSVSPPPPPPPQERSLSSQSSSSSSSSSGDAAAAAASAAFFGGAGEEEEEQEEAAEEEGEEDTDAMSGGGGPSAQAQLLMKHVSDLGLLLPGMQGSRISSIAARLEKPDEGEQFQALTELCEQLSMSTEEDLIGLRPDTVIPGLLTCLRNEYNPEMALLACRAFSHLMDALPNSVSLIVAMGVIPVFIEKVTLMTDIDLAEQSLICLEKVCHERALAVLSEGGMGAMLMFTDFFSLPLQRKILGSICAMVKRVPAALYSHVQGCLPQLSGLLAYDDARLVESTCLVFYRLACSFQDDEEKLSQIGSDEMLRNLIAILQRTSDGMSATTWSLVLKTLTLLARRSVSRTQTILGLDAHRTLLEVLRSQAEPITLSGDAAGATAAAAADGGGGGGGGPPSTPVRQQG
eukprot:Rhum_TRINITY_DN12946_c1_g1::Rhum_TRINITY_DN12946_c1_g1_i1::g.55630::m.55630/K10590/TRIP12; E3 ubiquitin-protein ligase TRIP12